MPKEDIKTNTPRSGLVTDLHESYIGTEVLTHARNVVMNSHLGQVQFVQNEPSTLKSVDLPLPCIGKAKLLQNRWALFLTNNTEHEIGIYSEDDNTYQKVINSPCLNFSTKHLIKAVSKEGYDCTETIYFTDGYNPRRYLNPDKIPYQYTFEDDACLTKKYNSQLDCGAILIERALTVPKLKPRNGGAGNLLNGSYQFGIAYAVGNQRVTEFYAITTGFNIWDHANVGRSISIDFEGLDRDYDQFELLVIYSTNGTVAYKRAGFYSTAERSVNVSSISEDLTPQEVLQVKPRYPYADDLVANDQYLLFSGIRTEAEVNYQLAAMKIKPKYVVKRVPADYYKRGTEKSLMRDEVYALGIQWLRASGEYSSSFHIPGIKDDTLAKTVASGKDVYEFQKGKPDKEVYVWEVENTAGLPIGIQGTGEERIIAEGEPGLYYSSEKYPNNREMFGDDACTPIRHIKTPDNIKSPHHSVDGKYIYILGLKFENIEHPKDKDGKYIEDIVGYRIVIGSRFGNKSVLAKGLFSNVRSYTEVGGNEVLYSNYGHNSLAPDPFLSSSQVYQSNGERGFKPLDKYKNDQFNFYSPETAFNHIGLGTEVKFYTEQLAEVDGYFQYVYQHPKAKLLTQFDLYFAMVIGAIDGYLSTKGKKCLVTFTNGTRTVVVDSVESAGLPATQVETLIGLQQAQVCDDILNGMTASDKSKNLLDLGDKFIIRALKALAAAGMFAYFALKAANTVLDVIYNASPFREYAVQYNSYGFYKGYKPIDKDNRRRSLEYYQYIYDGVNSVEGKSFNNFKREDSVYVRLNQEIKEPSVTDTTKKNIRDFNICGDFTKKTSSVGSMFYGAIKSPISNQYGQLDSINYLDTGYLDNSLSTTKEAGDRIYKSGGVFGGDIFITRMRFKRPFHYFTAELKDAPDGYKLDYRNYRNVGYPRFWIDSTPFDMSQIVSLSPSSSRTPKAKHNTSCTGNSGLRSPTTVKDEYFYTSNNSVIDFFVESEINLEYRDWKYDEPSFYSNQNSNINNLFRSDKLEKREEFVYDNSYSKALLENTINQQRLDYDSRIAGKCNTYHKNRVVYSLPAFKDQRADGWLTYLALNYKDFDLAEFGSLTGMHGIDKKQILFLFDKSAPYLTPGADQLQLGSGKKITLGDGGLFERELQPLAHTDYAYGNSQTKWAFVNTQFGSFYPSQRQGRIFGITGNLDELSRNGMHWWFKNHLPSKLLSSFPNYPHTDNTVHGVGLTSVFDNTNEIYYVSKKDYQVKSAYAGKIDYSVLRDKFVYEGSEVKLTDTEYFDDASWTISYSPKDKAFISWHDWIPDFTLQSENHFLTIKDQAIWKHNQRCDSYCNFYGIDYPFQFEFLASNGQNVEILRNVEYFLEVGKYYNNCRDFHMMLDDNFDSMMISNNEQHSGLLELNLQSKNNMSQLIGWPYYNGSKEAMQVLYSKEEQKYRVNQFSDLIRDRGEFSHRNVPIWITEANGYVKTLNPQAINYSKPAQLQKKFRNVWNKIMLTKQSCKEKKYIFKFANSRQTNSSR